MIRFVQLPIFTVIIILTLFTAPSYSWGQQSAIPVPERKANLQDLEKKLDKEKKQQNVLKRQLKDIKKELETTKSTLVKITKSIKEQEENLQHIEQQAEELEKEKSSITGRLKKEYGSIANLVLALERIRRTPPEALFIKPGAPLKTAQTAMLLQSIIPGIHKRAEQLTADLERLHIIEIQLEKDKQVITAAVTKLDKKYTSVTTMMNKRKELYKSTQKDYDKRATNTKRIAQEAQSLQELLTKLEKAQKKQQNDRMANASRLHAKSVIASIPMPKRGVTQLPISGVISVNFGEKDHIGAKSQGLTIKGRAGAIVVAPMGGIVRFAGYFKNHGNLVIIEHEKGYHSLVAGLARIDTVVGQTMESGEPLGLMETSGSDLPTIYYELRYKGTPVHPAKKFAGLG